jgi:hypothetical protein
VFKKTRFAAENLPRKNMADARKKILFIFDYLEKSLISEADTKMNYRR